ncbi:MAG: hypothetical protein REI12_10385, partial [Pedobacter sp.]|nr:hypothetical protein [Pedobacter sp.]
PQLKSTIYERNKSIEQFLNIRTGDSLQGGWIHFRHEQSKWSSNKYGLEYKASDLGLPTRALSAFKPPYFSYLTPPRHPQTMIIGGSLSGAVSSLYFTAL